MMPRVAVVVGLVAALFVGHVSGLYEDQAGLQDWTMVNVGRVMTASSQLPKGRLVFCATSNNVVAALSSRSGAVEWRRVLPETETLVSVRNTASVVFALSSSTSDNSLKVRSFSDRKGEFLWETTLSLSSPSSSPAVMIPSEASNLVVVASGSTLFARQPTRNQDLVDRWTVDLSSHGSTVLDVSITDSSTVCAAVASSASDSVLSSVTLVCLDAATGKEQSATSSSVPVKADGVALAHLESSGPAVLALDSRGDAIHVLTPNGKSTQSFSDLDGVAASARATALTSIAPLSTLPISSPNVFPAVVTLESGRRVVIGYGSQADSDTASSTVDADGETSTSNSNSNPNSSPPSVFVSGTVSTDDGAISAGYTSSGTYAAVLSASDDSIDTVAIYHVSSGTEVSGSDMLPSVAVPGIGTRGGIASAYLFGFTANARLRLRVLAVAGDDTVVLAQQGRPVWSRPEYLASFVDLTSVDAPGAAESHVAHKLAIGVAEVQGCCSGVYKLAAVSSQDKAVVWESGLEVIGAGAGASVKLVVTRAHPTSASSAPEVAVIYSLPSVSSDGWATRVVWYNAFTGQETNRQSLRVVSEQIVPVPAAVTADHAQVFLAHGTDGLAHVLPSTPEAYAAFESVQSSFVLHTGRTTAASQVGGFDLHPVDGAAGTYAVQPRWSLQLSPGQTVVAFSQPQFAEPVASSTIVLGDDSLLTKYLNPNLAGVVSSSEGDYGTSASTVEIRLVDMVSGRLLESRVHAHASGPALAVRQENWFVYTYWNTKAKRMEVGSFSLYGTAIARFELNPFRPYAASSDVTAFAPADPIVLRQSFVMPAGVSAMTPTRTRYGITAPHILFALKPGSLLLMDRRFLDPRRPLAKPTAEEQREKLMQYQAFLPIIHQSVISYNQTLPQLRLVHSAPTSLESTTLVFAAGLDLFFTPAAPSGAFDLLAADFNKPLLFGLTGGLFVLTAVAGYLAQEKRLRERWA